MERPKRLTEPNLELAYRAIEEYFDHLEDEETCEDTQNDMDDYLISDVIKALYGEDSDKYICEKLDEIENRE